MKRMCIMLCLVLTVAVAEAATVDLSTYLPNVGRSQNYNLITASGELMTFTWTNGFFGQTRTFGGQTSLDWFSYVGLEDALTTLVYFYGDYRLPNGERHFWGETPPISLNAKLWDDTVPFHAVAEYFGTEILWSDTSQTLLQAIARVGTTDIERTTLNGESVIHVTMLETGPDLVGGFVYEYYLSDSISTGLFPFQVDKGIRRFRSYAVDGPVEQDLTFVKWVHK